MSEESMKNKIQASMIAAMRAKDQSRLGTIRLIQAAIKQQEIDDQVVLTDEQILAMLDKMIRQRKESIKQFQAANRDDLVEKESAEMDVIQQFLPEPLSSEEIEAFVKQAIQETGAESVRDMAKIMAILKPKVQGRADIGELGQFIKSLLGA